MSSVYGCGIDPGVSRTTAIGMRLKKGEEFHLRRLTEQTLKSKEGDVIRLLEMKRQLKGLFRIDKHWERFVNVFVEGYSYGSRNRSLPFTIGEWGGVMKLTLHEMRKRVYVIPPTFWKKFITGKGNANKTEVAVSIMKHWGLEFSNEHEFDAAGIVIVGLCCKYGIGLDTKYREEQARDFKEKVKCYDRKPKK